LDVFAVFLYLFLVCFLRAGPQGVFTPHLREERVPGKIDAIRVFEISIFLMVIDDCTAGCGGLYNKQAVWHGVEIGNK